MLPCRLALGLGFWVLVNFLILYFQKQMVLRWRLEVGWGWGECWHSVPLAHINDTALLKKKDLRIYFVLCNWNVLVHLHTIAHILHATLPTISFELAHILYATLPTLSLVSAHILHATLPTFLPVRAYILYTTLPTFSWYLRTHAFCYAAKAFSGSCTHKFIHLCTMLCYAKKKKSCIEHGTLFKLQWLTRSPLKPKK
jgi:hypothetical protein